MEKYRLYRQQILNDGLMLDKLANESSIIKSYTDKINELNPKILDESITNSTIANLISVNLKKYEEVEGLKDFSNLIDEQKIANNQTEIDENIASNNFVSILDSSGRISNDWLIQDKNYVQLNETENKLVHLSNTWTSFQITSKDQIDKLDELLKSKKIYEDFQKYQIIPLDENQVVTRQYKTVYITSLCVSLVLLLITIIFLVVKLIV